jgi:hypothetical protein
MYTGQCLCGDICFEFDAPDRDVNICHCSLFDAPDRDVNICHCSLCRRMTGTAFGTYVKVHKDSLQITAGGKNFTAYAVTDKLDMISCATCGSYVYATHSDYADYAYVCLGVVDDNDDLRPTYPSSSVRRQAGMKFTTDCRKMTAGRTRTEPCLKSY